MLLQRIGNRGIRLGTLFDRAAAKYPTNVLLLDHDLDIAPERGRSLTMTDVADLVSDLGSRLWRAGLRPGDHLVVHKSNAFDITLLAVAAARIGAVPVLLSPQLDGDTVVALLRRVERPYLLTDAAKLTTTLPEAVFALSHRVLLASGTHGRATSLAELAGAPRIPALELPPDHRTLVTHTSGTTGLPKLAVHTAFSLQARYRPQALATALMRRREPVAIHVSFVHSRLFTALAISLLRGFPVAILADSEPGRVAELFARLRPAVLEAHPNTYLRWEELAADDLGPLSNVKLFSSTFDALHPRTVRTLIGASRRRSPRFGQIYGQSEVGPSVARSYGKHRSPDADGRCVGIPFPGMTGVRVVSRDGKRPTSSSPGYIEISSDGRIRTYLGEDERFSRQADERWWRMGDLGYRTRWGCLHLMDREVDEIPGFGSTLSVEDRLFSRIGELAEVVIIPTEDGAPLPVVCTKDDRPLDLAAWREATAGLPEMAAPLQWRRADLPQTATTKIKRLELAGLVRAGGPPAPAPAPGATAAADRVGDPV
ncbi:class I adenylate-forming enzyme family protein [Streptomyces spectabilis]|uniref:Acyl-coenzyme A synthetase/AMP-(Fatty) acid ligase n=1 Tax=Streptomyces spectabilis TaxID=68270 RepID=A0A5P2XCI7_STRST|nr:class I adenylate-forming enzyme family protein [Streptomyces spectabilis]MBB5104523.1 acyl-coenzyme A synthetase/AMP-(fatty) acid ligase [Streptomyces spectabilis]MCI3905122.1 acyl--CoA ligase [Streptomyces spectabilis]QEV62138.1 long-chain fatty acid--CoA ligase [Streptomyces spectabilis]GGV00501.1 putative fatty-acid-CoA ligase FadD [Streptomyces spectabilis]